MLAHHNLIYITNYQSFNMVASFDQGSVIIEQRSFLNKLTMRFKRKKVVNFLVSFEVNFRT